MMNAGEWTWLEVAKIVVGILMPLTLAVVGVALHRVTKRFEHLQWRGQKLLEGLLNGRMLSGVVNYRPRLSLGQAATLFLDEPRVVVPHAHPDGRIHLVVPLPEPW